MAGAEGTRRLAETSNELNTDSEQDKVVEFVEKIHQYQAGTLSPADASFVAPRAQDISCGKCFAANSENYFCLMGQDAFAGLCCDAEADKQNGCKATTANSDFCVQGSDARAAGTFKYTRCPFDQLKCGHPQRKVISDNWKRTIYTTLEFTKDAVCPYYITNEIAF